MENSLKWLKALALGTVPVVGAFLCVLMLQVSFQVDQNGRLAQSALGQLNSALVTVNQPCGSVGHVQPCGTLAEIDKLATHGSDLEVQTGIVLRDADRVSQMEMGMLPRWDAQVTSTLGNVDKAAAKVPGLLQSAQDRMDGLKPLEDNLARLAADVDTGSTATLGQVQKTIAEVDARLADPNVQKLVASSAQLTGNLAATSEDFQMRFHSYLFPPPCTNFWCRLERLWPYIRGAASVGEAAYWTRELFAGAKP